MMIVTRIFPALTTAKVRPMPDKLSNIPDNTAVRTALWRALHVELDSPPHIFEDTLGLQLADPEPDWRARPDMSAFTRPFRAAIVARARFVEDCLAKQVTEGVAQYVIMGAGLDTFAQRQPQLATHLQIFEIDQPAMQEWKKHRLLTLGLGIPNYLHWVPVNFETEDDWLAPLSASGFAATQPALVAATGLSMYLTPAAIEKMLRQLATLAPGSTLVLSFMLPIELNDPDLRPSVERAAQGARAQGTPWLCFFTPKEILALALDAGFSEVEHISAAALSTRYFMDRTDGLRLPNAAEEILLART